MTKSRLKNLLIIVGLLAANASVIAEENSEPVAPPALRGIMLGLDKNMQMIAHGISLEDWQLVETMALNIANHPKPPMSDRKRIKQHFGPDMVNFKSHDMQTHHTAKVLSEVAAKKDGNAVIAEYAKLQTACLGCHQAFREPFRKHFYQQK